MLSDAFGRNQAWSGVILVALAMLGTLTSLGISRVPAANPTKKFQPNPLAGLWQQLRIIRADRVLFLAVVGSTFLWFLGALYQPTILFYGKDLLQLNDTQSGYLQASLAIGIGLGSVAAGYLSGKKIEYGLIPLGAAGLTVFGALLARDGLTFGSVAVNLGLLGFAAGFYNVPIAALIQHRPDAGNKGGVIAASAMLSFIGIFAASGVYFLLVGVFRLTPQQVFLFASILTAAGAIYVVKLVPDSLLRLMLWIVTRTCYRVRVDGRDNIPEKGGALFVSNHVSWVDALLLIASTDRHVRFIMYKGTYDLPYVKPFARVLGIIPISSEQRPREMIKSLQAATDALKAGQIVCIFAEGQITRIGRMLPFRRGFERIMKDPALDNTPIVPVALDGVWGSIFSFSKRRFVWKWPRRFPYPVTVSFGKPMPRTATPFEVRQAVQELMADAWSHRRDRMMTMPRAFVRTARVHPFRFAMVDPQSARINFIGALTRAIVLARRLRPVWRDQEMVGLLLPPSVPGALANHAAMLLGKVPVNLNYTVSEQTLASCIQQCDIKTVLTSRAFLEKVKLKVDCKTVFIEDVMGLKRGDPERPVGDDAPKHAGSETGAPDERADKETGVPTAIEKLIAVLMAWLLPAPLLERALASAQPSTRDPQPPLDRLATVIFSSGSTGEPKGVMLSHYNIGSNIEQMEQVFGVTHRDRFLGVLPFFHSFGFTGTLCLPAVLGLGAVYHVNPLDAKTVGPLVRDNAVTFLLTTPTFLQLYTRGCDPADFGSLRVVMTAAEKLPERLAVATEEKFGIRPMEGYGCPECAPAVAVNTHDFRSAGFRQVGAKRGKIGHPLPGVSVRIVDVDNPWNGTASGADQPGLLLVRGPNVMRGYLGKPDKTAEVLLDGWYSTGDIAALDEDGFLQITDRLSRFSKIGGEMVPHIKVEEKLHELAGTTEQTFVVAGVPDEKKGERLVVLHKLSDDRLQPCLEKVAQSDLPNLWKPKADAFYYVDAFPMLGTGKLDLRKVRELALHRSATGFA
ncbi:MAG TPA: MFS transporter, partial [Verrucomicrobiota bacterium]|nr:MFS transporter [Verrucomicrobiota bacterium]